MSAVPEEHYAEYSEVVWQAFVAKTGQEHRLMGSGEWWTLLGWLRTGIPLRVTLRGLREAGGKGRTLTYYDGAVREAYATWYRMLSFGGPTPK